MRLVFNRVSWIQTNERWWGPCSPDTTPVYCRLTFRFCFYSWVNLQESIEASDELCPLSHQKNYLHLFLSWAKIESVRLHATFCLASMVLIRQLVLLNCLKGCVILLSPTQIHHRHHAVCQQTVEHGRWMEPAASPRRSLPEIHINVESFEEHHRYAVQFSLNV